MATTRQALIIKHSDSLLSLMIDCLNARSQPFEVADTMADAIKLLSKGGYQNGGYQKGVHQKGTHRLLLCDWGIFGGCCQLQKNELITKLLEHRAPLLLVSAAQEVSVRFRNLEGHSVYSYRPSALMEHFAEAVDLAKMAKRVDRQRAIGLSAPHFPTGLVIENPQLPTNLHLF